MTTVSPKPAAPRRPPSASPTPAPSITRGATARSAVSPRVTSSLNSAAGRRTTTKTAQSRSSLNQDAREALEASLRQETDHKEQLLVQLQDKDQTITSLTSEVENLNATLHTAETRLNELYTEQARSEADLAQRIDIAEKLRAQVRELEKEKRDIQRRYNEQTTTFEAERQAFYDNEQHLKSRIQSLSEAVKRAEETAKQVPEPEVEEVEEQEAESKPIPKSSAQDLHDPESEPAEMTALKLELSTLSTSHSSLQSTLLLLQSQLMDLKRVNNGLQEENESYMILLRERTLNGQFDLIRQVGTTHSTSEDEVDESDDDSEQRADVGSLHSIGRSTLDRVDEEGEGTDAHISDGASVEGDLEKPRYARHPSRQGRKRTNSTRETKGESLADLPITGPGLDLAAELGRAENKDTLGNPSNLDDQVYNGKQRRKKGSDGRKVSGSTDNGLPDPTISAEMETMRSEIKSLKDANKALSLYASKIIDRIIAQEGFEHVLAADYEKDKVSETPSASGPNDFTTKQAPALRPKTRPQSLFVGKSLSIPTPTADTQITSPNPVVSAQPVGPSPKVNRRSLSFDWKGFSLFNNNVEKKPDPNLRPLTLKPGSTTLSNARKLDTEEDDEDRKERERLNATMKLMGIQPTPQLHTQASPLPAVPIERSQSDTPTTATNNRRFSIFGLGNKSTDNSSDKLSVLSTPTMSQTVTGNGSPAGLGSTAPASLTQEALERAEAENSLAALDAHERNLSIELAKGGSGGFTEIAQRPGRRSRRSVGGSGSTVWSAGMSAADE